MESPNRLSNERMAEKLPKSNNLTIHIDDFPIYDESSITFKSFLNDFESLARVAALSEDTKLALLSMRLQRRPKLFYRRLSKDQKQTYEMAVKALMEVFDCPEDKRLTRIKLHSLKQNDSSLVEYAEEIEELFTELEIEPKFQFDFFIAGLDYNSRNCLIQENFSSYEKAVKFLQMKQSIEKRQTTAVVSTVTTKQNSRERKNDRYFCYFCRIEGHFERNCWLKRKR